MKHHHCKEKGYLKNDISFLLSKLLFSTGEMNKNIDTNIATGEMNKNIDFTVSAHFFLVYISRK